LHATETRADPGFVASGTVHVQAAVSRAPTLIVRRPGWSGPAAYLTLSVQTSFAVAPAMATDAVLPGSVRFG
jgi:hypothetical protein